MEDKQDAGRTRSSDKIEVRDVRELPTVTATKAELDVIGANFDGRSLPIARSLWLALLELADTGSSFVATRKSVADRAGISKRVLDEYVPRMVEVGLLAVESREDDRGRSIPARWLLRGCGSCVGLRSGSPPSSSSTNNVGNEDGEERRVQQPHPESWEGLPKSIATDAQAFLKAKRREHGRVVTEAEMVVAAHALAAFNAAQDAEHGLGANLAKLVARIRERPSWDAPKMVRLVESAWRHKWWENSGSSGRRPTPAVVFGNANVFEQVAMDAAADAAGKPVENTPQRQSRFSRTVEPE